MTGKMGLVRNLTAGEILAQVFFALGRVKKHGMVSVSGVSFRSIVTMYAVPRVRCWQTVGMETASRACKAIPNFDVFDWAERKRTSRVVFQLACPAAFIVTGQGCQQHPQNTCTCRFRYNGLAFVFVPFLPSFLAPAATANKRGLHGNGRAARQSGSGDKIAGAAHTPVCIRDS